MDDRLQHDPRTKQQIKDLLYNYIYEPVLKQSRRRLDDIIMKNCALLQLSFAAFHYKGVAYQTLDATLPPRRQHLATSLHVYMDEYLVELDKLNNYELPYVLGFLSQVLNSSSELQDYITVLPDSVHKPIQSLIASCPCRQGKLDKDAVLDLQIRNQVSINLIKQRLFTNLLI